ncbi:MAG: macrocin O-methyltransferase [Bacteroidetes bacterium]|nr:macrocin O-methyltransferase [Bacteroidota bacterium]
MIRQFLNKLFGLRGWRLEKLPASTWPVDFDDWHRTICQRVAPFTMTSPERIYGLVQAVRYIQAHRISGSIVECGVWKGGSMLACAETLLHLGDSSRDLYLYDTFEGMPPPKTVDETIHDRKAAELLEKDANKSANLIWAYSTLSEVQETLRPAGYPSDKIHYVVGKVEDTIPATIPEQIALLRLDTDWYASTRHELMHLFPRLVPGGVLIIDDYGYWKGARQAVDEYFAQTRIPIFLSRMDDTGRIAIKP